MYILMGCFFFIVSVHALNCGRTWCLTMAGNLRDQLFCFPKILSDFWTDMLLPVVSLNVNNMHKSSKNKKHLSLYSASLVLSQHSFLIYLHKFSLSQHFIIICSRCGPKVAGEGHTARASLLSLLMVLKSTIHYAKNNNTAYSKTAV